MIYDLIEHVLTNGDKSERRMAELAGEEMDNVETQLTTQAATIAAQQQQIEALRRALEVIEERCDEELGEWSSVEYAHLPINMSVFWYLRENARAILLAVTPQVSIPDDSHANPDRYPYTQDDDA